MGMNRLKQVILLSIVTLLVPSCHKPSASSFISSESSSIIEPSVFSSSEESSICKHTNLSEEEVIKKPTIIQSGLNRVKCLDCGETFDKATYKLDEYVFEDAYYMYDEESHDLLIKGMIPYGTTVE